MISYFQIISDYNLRLSETLKKLEEIADDAEIRDAGKLKIRRKGTHCAFFLRENDGENRRCTYIRKDNPFLRRYVNHRFCSDALRILKKNCRAAQSFLKKHSGKELEMLASSYPEEFQQINRNLAVTPYVRKTDWKSNSFETNRLFPENKVHLTKSGIAVRSKSEAMIADALTARHILWRYECRLNLADAYIPMYPDFTIFDPDTGREYYWEHLGLMDEKEYAAEACKKIRRYLAAGIIPGRNLILTMESQTVPLSLTDVERTINAYFSSIGR